MMKLLTLANFKRCLWLFAWCVWLWLGVGLSRELPRNFGTPLLELPDDAGDVGDFLDTGELQMNKRSANGEQTVAIWDVHGRRRLLELPAPGSVLATISPRHGFAVGQNHREWMRDFANDSLWSLDLRTGAWKELRVPPRRIYGFHPRKPWAIFELPRRENGAPVAAVIDLRTAARVAEWNGGAPPAGRQDHVYACHFAGDDELLLLIERNANSSDESARTTRFERWSLADGRRESTALDRPYHSCSFPSADGRVACEWSVDGDYGFGVVDSRTGAALLTSDTSWLRDAVGRNSVLSPWPAMDATGRGILSMRGALWRVDERRLLWSPRSEYETVYWPNARRGFFFVTENWGSAFPKWPWISSLLTTAVRDFGTGSVLFRIWSKNPRPNRMGPGLCTSILDRDDGANTEVVYDFPPHVNWPLLALCQTILALPLVLLWAALAWRRRRAARREPAEAVMNQ